VDADCGFHDVDEHSGNETRDDDDVVLNFTAVSFVDVPATLLLTSTALYVVDACKLQTVNDSVLYDTVYCCITVPDDAASTCIVCEQLHVNVSSTAFHSIVACVDERYSLLTTSVGNTDGTPCKEHDFNECFDPCDAG
jgi:hypothetical protein